MIRPFVIDLGRGCLSGFCVGIIALLLAQGCSTPSRSSAVDSDPTDQSVERVILDHLFSSGFTRRGREQAVIVSAFEFWRPDIAFAEVPLPSAGIRLFVDQLTRIGDLHDLMVCGRSGSLDHLESVVAGGCPVLILVSEPGRVGQKHRPLLVYGFDAKARLLYLHEGRRRPVIMAYGDFLRIWQPERNFMMTIVPPDRDDWLPILPEMVASAEFHARKGEWTRAADLYGRGEALAPGDLSLLYAQASVWERAGDWPAAEIIYREILDRDRMQSRAANNLAHVLGARGEKSGEALQWARRATVIDPGNPVYLATLGAAHKRAGHLADAVSSFEKAHHRAAELPRSQQREIVTDLVQSYMATDQQHLARQVAVDYKKHDPEFDPISGLVLSPRGSGP